LLAARHSWTAVDADHVFEQQAGRTIREIFASEGEAGFRDREAAILAELCRQSQQVVATGGGVVLRPENRTLLKKSGAVIWLTADAATIWQRLQQDATTLDRRPNLTIGGLAEIEELLRQRATAYAECADVTVETASRTAQEVADAIWQWLAGRYS
jgi:shikimate kinase